MSSNAFARSRPRVRHQRVPRTHSCDHPRFIQLVNELARLNELKKKQEEADGRAGSPERPQETPSGHRTTTTTATTTTDVGVGNNNINNTNNNNSSSSSSSSSTSSSSSSSSSSSISSGNSIASGININGIGNDCCSASGSQTLNGYRSLESNQSSSLHDNFHHHQQHLHQQQHNQNQHHTHHHHHQQHLHQHHHHYHYNQQHHQEPQQQYLGNTMQHQTDERCPGKSSATNFGYSKQNLVVEQTNANSDISNNINSSNSDLRQDENRSKRKRSNANDTSTLKKNSASSCGASCSSKRHKSAPEAIRPLSPSFTKCPICLLDSMDRDPSFTNTCFHLFCYVCIENWTKNKATCPLCRTKFTKIIYNIKSATNYEEKVASPIRRDDDDGYIADRFMLEHLSNLNTNSAVSSRNANSDDVQFLFENLSRNPEVLMPQYFVNQMDPRQGDSLHSFNAVTTPANFNSNVPHPPYTPTSYPMTPTNYIVGTLLPPNRINPMASTAITSAYTANTSLTNINNERRVSRRLIYSRPNYEPPTVDTTGRVLSRTSSTTINQNSVPIERSHHNQHQHHHQQHHHHNQHRAILDMRPRHDQRMDQAHAGQISLPYPIPPRHYNHPNAGYTRRPYNNPQVEHHHQHLLDTLYRQMPEM